MLKNIGDDDMCIAGCMMRTLRRLGFYRPPEPYPFALTTPTENTMIYFVYKAWGEGDSELR